MLWLSCFVFKVKRILYNSLKSFFENVTYIMCYDMILISSHFLVGYVMVA